MNKQFYLKLFRPSAKIVTNDNTVLTVDHVHIKNNVLLVQFVELEGMIEADKIDCEPTLIDLTRKSKN